MKTDFPEKVSVIIPIYNAEEFLHDCLSSVSRQSYKNIEIICIDDGSKDCSFQICQEWSGKDPRFHVLSQKNQGVSSARNLALSQATGEYICFVDSDDLIASDHIANLVDMTNYGMFPICGYTTNKKDLGKGKKKKFCYNAKDYIRHIIYETIDHPNLWQMLFKSRIIRDNDLMFTLGCVRNEDTEFFINYLIYESDIIVSNYCTYYYRTDNLSSAMRKPITVSAFTSIEASQRINLLLFQKEIIRDDSIALNNAILNYAFFLSKEQNIDLYNFLHVHYDVRKAMKKMLYFPRLVKKMVSLAYLILGRIYFYRFIGLLTRCI